MKRFYYVCRWNTYGAFWERVSGVFSGIYGKQDAESLAKHWGEGYTVQDDHHSVALQ